MTARPTTAVQAAPVCDILDTLRNIGGIEPILRCELQWRPVVRVASYPIRLSASVINLADKSYWMGRGGSTTFGLSMPRTFQLSVQADF